MTDIAASPSTAQRSCGAGSEHWVQNITQNNTQHKWKRPKQEHKVHDTGSKHNITQNNTPHKPCATQPHKVDNASTTSTGTEQVKWKSCLMKFFASFTPASLPHCPLAWSWTNCLLFKTAHPPLFLPPPKIFRPKNVEPTEGTKFASLATIYYLHWPVTTIRRILTNNWSTVRCACLKRSSHQQLVTGHQI